MRTYIKLIAVLLLLTGCNDFLDEEPVGFRTPTSFYQNADEIDRALAGVYNQHRRLYSAGQGTMLRFGEMRSDNTNIEITGDGGGFPDDELNEFTMISDNVNIANFWGTSYRGITLANFLLANINNVDYVNQDVKNARTGEAIFLRAAMYFNLVRIYGDVPYVTNPGLSPDQILSEEFIDRDPQEDIYESILEEAQRAIDLLPVDASDPGRATRGAALMLKAKIYMTYQEQYGMAIPLLEEIRTLGYSLLPNYADVFLTKNHNEGIFEIQYSPSLDQGANFFTNFVPFVSGQDILGSNSNPNSRGNQFQPTQSIIDLYDNTDARKTHNISTYLDDDTGIEYPWVSKFAKPFDTVQFNQQDINWQMYRYADALLMLAECYQEVGGGDPVALIGQIRTRAGLSPNLTPAEAADLEQTIADERRRELAFEGHRFFDLLRTGRLVQVMTAHGQDQIAAGQTVTGGAYQNIRTVVGLPLGEILEFGFDQTEGWD